MSMKDIKIEITFINKKRLSPYRRFFCFLVFLCACSLSHAQVGDYVRSFKEKRSLYFTWDSKATFISNRYAQIKSIKFGFNFGGKTTFGMGYNWYHGKIVRSFDQAESIIPLTANLKFRYVSVFSEYTYFKNERWEATIPAQVGIGIMQYNQEFTKNRVPNAGGLFMLYEPTSTITYRFLRYFGVGLGIGYRLVILLGPNPQKENLQSPIVTFMSKIYFDTVWNDMKGLKKRKKKEK